MPENIPEKFKSLASPFLALEPKMYRSFRKSIAFALVNFESWNFEWW